jgi:gliding motility-associated-like protein
VKAKKLFYLITCVALSSLKGHAQLNASVIGDAQVLDNNCFLITPALDFQTGGVWYDNAIDFSNDFTVYYQNYFGSNDANGADGMALVFKRTSNPVIGVSGGGVGYEGITQSMIVEFDTWQNTDRNDPVYDHIAIMKNGISNHTSVSNLAGPIQASGTSVNIEDGTDHEVKIEWIASTQTFNVYFDCDLRLSITDDIKNTIFGGDPTVYFGFVGSTGGSVNIHRVCFNSISFVDNLTIDDKTICNGDDIQIDASIPSGDTYLWSPAEGVSDVDSPVPTLSPTVTTTYSVLITDICGDPSTQSVTINVIDGTTPVFDQVPQICQGDTLNSLPSTSIEGISGAWAPALDNTSTTTYNFTPDAGQCASDTTMTIVVEQTTTPSFTQIGPICEGDTFTLPSTSNEGITGTWSPAVDNALTTEYTFVPTAGQCASNATMTVVVEQATTTNFTQLEPVCNGNSFILVSTSNEGISGTWSPAINNTLTTEYTFTPDPGQCALSATMTVVIEAITTPSFAAIDSVCEGDTINELPTSSNEGITGNWSPALDNTLTTTYTFTPDPNQCASTANTIITVIANSSSNFNQLDPICEGDTFILPSTSNEGITGNWSPAVDNALTTEYTFVPTAGQCATEAVMTVTVIPLITPLFTQVDTICIGDTLLDLPTTSNNSIAGAWSPAINNTSTTEYTFTPNPGLSCVPSTTMTITVLAQTIPNFTQVAPVCVGDFISPLPQTSNNGITGTWTPSLNNLETTTYIFTSDAGQCADSTTMTIVVNTISALTINATNASEDFDSNQVISVSATGGSEDYEYQLDGGVWQSNSTFEYVTGCEEHTVAVRDALGCSTIPEKTVMIMEYPKFFTPNGDGYNDTWNIKCLKNNSLAEIFIFDRFGKLLLEFRPSQDNWDGTFNGQLLAGGDYWFLVSYLNSSGIKTQFRSHFSLRY